MTYGAWEVVGQDYQELPIGKTIGDALRGLIRKRWKNNAAKLIERGWGLDRKTAINVASYGKVSERTLTKAALSESWPLWMALGEELFGQSYADWEEHRLEKIIEEAARDLDRVRRLRPQTQAVPEGSFAARATGVLDDSQEVEPAARGARGGRVRALGERASGRTQ